MAVVVVVVVCVLFLSSLLLFELSAQIELPFFIFMCWSFFLFYFESGCFELPLSMYSDNNELGGVGGLRTDRWWLIDKLTKEKHAVYNVII